MTEHSDNTDTPAPTGPAARAKAKGQGSVAANAPKQPNQRVRASAGKSDSKADDSARITVRPTVQPARRQWRHVLLMMSFLAVVVMPVVVSGFYLWTQAADQYASKIGFAVRREDSNSALELLSGLTQVSGTSSSDTDILFEFIQSQKLVAALDAELDLRTMWSRPQNDWVFRYDPEGKIEDLVKYWNQMVQLSFGSGSGLLEVEVRAFNPGDAYAISEALFEKCAEQINELSAIARVDAIRYSHEDLDKALDRLKSAREAVTQFRNENQLVDPQIDLQGQAGLLNTLQAKQAEALIDIDLLADAPSEDDPRLVQAQRRLKVIESRIAAEREKLGFRGGAADGTALADVIGEYERLSVDREFAERTYLTALAAYDTAVAEAQRKTRYLAAYMEPTRAESPEYPHRLTLLMLTATILFMIWAITTLILYSVRDRR